MTELIIGGRGVGIKMSWVEKNQKIKNRGAGGRGGGTIIRDSTVGVLFAPKSIYKTDYITFI